MIARASSRSTPASRRIGGCSSRTRRRRVREPCRSEAAASRQDRRDFGTRLRGCQGHGAPVRCGRRRVPHQYEPCLARGDARARRVRSGTLEAQRERPIGILADLQGPKLRIGTFADGSVELAPGAALRARRRSGARRRRAACICRIPRFSPRSSPAISMLLDDGKIALRIVEATTDRAVTEVVTGGKLANRKGVSVPDTVIPIAAMTEKDRSDAEAAIDAGVDWIAVSFVQRPEDIAEVKKLAQGRTRRARQDREAAGGGALRGDHGGFRRRHGGARRSRRRDAAREGSRHPEAHHAPDAADRQARGGRDADARIDDHEPGADARRGLGRRDGRLRGRRRRDALGRERRRALSGRGGRP